MGGNRVGDHVVTVAGEGVYVLECKDRSGSLPAIVSELDAPAANREAAAAIAVFSSPRHCPVSGPLAIFEEKVVVVYAKDEQDPAALQVACAWARAQVLAAANPEGGRRGSRCRAGRSRCRAGRLGAGRRHPSDAQRRPRKITEAGD